MEEELKKTSPCPPDASVRAGLQRGNSKSFVKKL